MTIRRLPEAIHNKEFILSEAHLQFSRKNRCITCHRCYHNLKFGDSLIYNHVTSVAENGITHHAT